MNSSENERFSYNTKSDNWWVLARRKCPTERVSSRVRLTVRNRGQSPWTKFHRRLPTTMEDDIRGKRWLYLQQSVVDCRRLSILKSTEKDRHFTANLKTYRSVCQETEKKTQRIFYSVGARRPKDRWQDGSDQEFWKQWDFSLPWKSWAIEEYGILLKLKTATLSDNKTKKWPH